MHSASETRVLDGEYFTGGFLLCVDYGWRWQGTRRWRFVPGHDALDTPLLDRIYLVRRNDDVGYLDHPVARISPHRDRATWIRSDARRAGFSLTLRP